MRDGECRSIFLILFAKGSSAADIHRELCLVNEHTVMSERKVTECCRGFKNGTTYVKNGMAVLVFRPTNR